MVHTSQERLRSVRRYTISEMIMRGEEGELRCGLGSDTRVTLEDDDAVSEVGGHDEVVLDDECGLLGVEDEAMRGKFDEGVAGCKVAETYRLMTFDAMIRCSESKNLLYAVNTPRI